VVTKKVVCDTEWAKEEEAIDCCKWPKKTAMYALSEVEFILNVWADGSYDILKINNRSLSPEEKV